MRADVAFEEASVDLSRRVAERISAMRSGNWQGAQKPKKGRRPPFVLRSQGWPAIAIFWKNLISAGHFFTGRAWFFLIWIVIVAGLILRSGGRHAGEGVALSILAVSLAVMSLLYGPQILRHDFRQDLRVADVLKLYPMSGWQMVLGEILAPIAILAGAQWLLILFAFLFCPANFGGAPAPVALRVSIALSAALVMPCVDCIALLLPNAAALIFPAWVQLGKDTPRGFETDGAAIDSHLRTDFGLDACPAPGRGGRGGGLACRLVAAGQGAGVGAGLGGAGGRGRPGGGSRRRPASFGQGV